MSISAKFNETPKEESNTPNFILDEEKIKNITKQKVNSKPKAKMVMLAYQGESYVQVGSLTVDTAKDNTFMFKGIGQYRIDLEGKGAVSHYQEGLPVCYYDIRYDLPLYSSWFNYTNAKSSRYAKKIWGEKTLEVILKVAKSSMNMQILNIVIGLGIGLPVGMILGSYIHLGGGK